MRKLWLSVFYLLVIMAFGFVLLTRVLPYVLPFVLSIVVAVIIEPAVLWLCRKTKVSRGVAVALVLCVTFGTLLTVLGIALSRLMTELFELAGSLPQYYREAVRLIEEVLYMVGEFTQTLPTPLKQLLDQQVGRLYIALERVLVSILDGLKGLPPVLGVLVVTLISTFFMSRDKDLLLGTLVKLAPDLAGSRVTKARREVLESTVGLLKAQMVLVTITAVFVTCVLWLMGIDYALVLGLAIGILDILPVVGPGVVFVPWVAYNLVFGDVVLGLMLLAVYGGISIVRQVLEAKIIGERIGIHPLVTLLALYLGLQLFGAKGILIGPLVAVLLKAVVNTGILPGWPGEERKA